MAPALAALSLSLSLSLSLVLFSCENQPDTTGEDPTVPVPDPEGTVTVSIRNEDSGGTSVYGIRIDEANNFCSNDDYYFTSLGSMQGLGNVTRIPSIGWGRKAAVIPGNGYVAYYSYSYGNGGFYRIYVDSYILNTSNEILGATIKYQQPFCPAGTIKLPFTSFRFPASGGNQNIVFENTDIIPFGWSVVDENGILDYIRFYSSKGSLAPPEGIEIGVGPNTSADPQECVITITDCNGNAQDISIVIDGGVEP